MTQKNKFKDKNVSITDGSRVLGSVIGNDLHSCRQNIEQQKQNYLQNAKNSRTREKCPSKCLQMLTNSATKINLSGRIRESYQ